MFGQSPATLLKKRIQYSCFLENIAKFLRTTVLKNFSRHGNVVKTSLLTLPQRFGTVENESCADVSFRRCDNVALRRYQDVGTTLLQHHHNIKHWISRPFYYGLF